MSDDLHDDASHEASDDDGDWQDDSECADDDGLKIADSKAHAEVNVCDKAEHVCDAEKVEALQGQGIEAETEDLKGGQDITVRYHTEVGATSRVLVVPKKMSSREVLGIIKKNIPIAAKHCMADVFVNDKQLILCSTNCFAHIQKVLPPDHEQFKENEKIENSSRNSEMSSDGEHTKAPKKMKKAMNKKHKSKDKSHKKPQKQKIEKQDTIIYDQPLANLSTLFEKEEYIYINESRSFNFDSSYSLDVLLEDTNTFSLVQTYKLQIREAIQPSCHYFSPSQNISLKAIGLIPFTSDLGMTIKLTNTYTGTFTYCRAYMDKVKEGEPIMVFLENSLLIMKSHNVAISLVDQKSAKGKLCATRNENASCIGTDGTQFSFLSARKFPLCALYYQSSE